MSEILESVKRQKEHQAKSAIIDPINTMYFGGTRQKPTAVPYQTLRRMADIPAVSAILNTRLNQVARFAKRPRFSGDIGFRIGTKDTEVKMTDAQKKKAKEIEDFFLKTGWKKDPLRKDNFNTFLRKIVRDSLTLDVVAFEKVPKIRGSIRGTMDVAELWAVDGATIELVINNPIGEGYEETMRMPEYAPETPSGRKQAGNIAYVQKVNGVITAEYTEDEMAFAIRNPSTDLMSTDFGKSELETLMEIVTGIVNGVRYNTSYFSHSHLPQGVLELVGKYEDKHLDAFKRHWKMLTDGASGKWSVPVMGLTEGQGFKFTPFKNSNRDMEFNEFLEFLFNIACAVYQIDPNEVGFKSWTSGNSVTQSDNTSVKMDESKDKGFIPLMTFLSDTFNSEVVDLIDDTLVFEWVGLDEEDIDRKLEREKMELEMGKKTVNELRKADDLDEIEEDWANAPANAQLIQVYMNGKQQEQAEQQQTQQQAQGETDRANALEDGQMGHDRQMEVMDKQHAQNMEAKKADQEHQSNLAKQKSTTPAQKNTLKKSIEDEFRSVGIEIDWSSY